VLEPTRFPYRSIAPRIKSPTFRSLLRTKTPRRRAFLPLVAETPRVAMLTCRLACLMMIAVAQALLSRETHSLQPDVVVLQAVQQEEVAGVGGSHAVLGATWPRPYSGTTVVQGGLQSEYAPPPPPTIASLQSHALALGTTHGFSTTPDDVEPGHCLRLEVHLPKAGRLSVEARSIGGAPLAALYVSEEILMRCPDPGESTQMAAAETAPGPSGYVALDACVREAGRWQIYASGTVGQHSVFNVTASLGDRCAAALLDKRRGWLDSTPPLPVAGWLEVAGWLVGALLALGLLSGLALCLSTPKGKSAQLG
jgi:hypothetical protein